jgi:hypothetical protein
MGLKTFHIVFIVASLLLCLGLGSLFLVRYSSDHALADLLFGSGWLAGALAMIFYGRYVLRRLRHVGYL